MKHRKHLQMPSASISKRKLIFGILSVLFACLIFAFSARNGEESTEDSYEVGMVFGTIVHHDFPSCPEEEQLAFASKVDHPIRKTAHATEYAVFAMLLVGAWYDRKRKTIYNGCIPWIVSTAYAATDEFHQLFVPGRSGQVSDVLLDSFGSAVGITVLLLAIFAWNAVRNRD